MPTSLTTRTALDGLTSPVACPSKPYAGSSPALLEVENLCVKSFQTGLESISILDHVSFNVLSGETVGILGESGCGKTTLARALMRILPPGLGITSGSVTLGADQLLGADESLLRTLRGNKISVIHQEAEGALHPLMRVREQLAEIFCAHRSWNRQKRHTEAQNILEEVFKQDADRMSRSYPHELSGGQRQRVLIAQAIACRPALVVADEPTASLDLATQSEIISLIDSLKRRHGMSLILISHNPGVLWALANHVIVMYAGKIVERGSREQVFASPLHPYTQALLRLAHRSIPPLGDRKPRLASIPGSAPDLGLVPRGCAYAPRCESRRPDCGISEPEMTVLTVRQQVRCLLHDK